MPAGLKDSLDQAAVQAKRSLTAEIIARLEASFHSPLISFAELDESRAASNLEETNRRLDEISNRLDELLEAKKQRKLKNEAAGQERIEPMEQSRSRGRKIDLG